MVGGPYLVIPSLACCVRYFVGKFKNVDKRSMFRVMRRTTRKTLFGRKVTEHMTSRGKFVRTKGIYSQVRNLFVTREAARREMKDWQGECR